MEFHKERKNLVSFFVLTFLISWILWLPSVLATLGIIPSSPIQILGNFAVFGPFIAAFWLSSKKGDPGEGKRLFKSGWKFKIKKTWIAVFFLPIFLAGLALVIVSIIEPLDRLQYTPSVSMWIPNFLLFYFIGGPFTEEYGWRGYALDRIQTKYSALNSSLILGLIWGIWHIPLFFILGTVQSNIPIYEFLSLTIIISVFYTWIINNNRDAEGRPIVFLAILFHAMSNFSSMIFPYWVTSLGRWILFVLNVIPMVIISIVYGSKSLVKDQMPRSEKHVVLTAPIEVH